MNDERREFIKKSAMLGMTLGLEPSLPWSTVSGYSSNKISVKSQKAKTFVGVQLGAHSVFDEGIDRVLDNLANAEVNALFVYTHMYQVFSKQRKPDALAPDHGITPINPSTRELTPVWVETHEKYYKNTSLRHFKVPKSHDYAGKDVMAAIIEPAKKRGIKVYGRALAPDTSDMTPLMPEFAKVACIDHLGQPHHQLCFNQPDYHQWWLGTIEDVISTYPVDGFKWGYERSGPLSTVLATPEWLDDYGFCFCEHCTKIAREAGIDPDRARKGYTELHAFISKVKKGQIDESARDGIFVTVLRMFMKYPELLSWERQYYRNREKLASGMYAIIKRVRPQAEFGRHVWQMMSFDPFYRAAYDYSEVADHHDFIKPVVYNAPAGDRIKRWAMNSMSEGLFKEVDKERLLQFLYDVLNYDNEREPDFEETSNRGFSSDYVYRETKRCVDAVKGKSKVYSGIGIDIFGQTDSSDPAQIKEATLAALRAGSDGLLVSREYDEMRISSLKAVGDGVREWENG